MDVGGVKLASHNLRDFLRIKEEDHRRGFNQSTSSNGGGGRSNSSGLTLLAVLGEKRGPPPPADEPRRSVQSTRTLLDIIREDQISGRGGGGRRDDRSSWRHLRDKIRLRHRGSGSAWSSAVAMTSSDVSFTNTHPGESSQGGIPAASDVRVPILHGDARREEIERTSGRFERTSPPTRRRLISEVEEERSGDAVEEEGDGDEAEQPVRTSLMALLAENDWPIGSEGSAHMMPEEDEEVGVPDEEKEEEGGGGVGYNNCCVCLVRHKGAAFIPCGHTFCRLCSRELWVQRGNCPLCNNHISEILDIF